MTAGGNRYETTLFEFITQLHHSKETVIRANGAEGTELDLKEAKRSPLSPEFPYVKRESKKSGDNSDRKTNPST